MWNATYDESSILVIFFPSGSVYDLLVNGGRSIAVPSCRASNLGTGITLSDPQSTGCSILRQILRLSAPRGTLEKHATRGYFSGVCQFPVRKRSWPADPRFLAAIDALYEEPGVWR